MEISTKEYAPIELVTIKGRVDSREAARLARALETAQHRGKYQIIADKGQLEYMSSAGFTPQEMHRATVTNLSAGQANTKIQPIFPEA